MSQNNPIGLPISNPKKHDKRNNMFSLIGIVGLMVGFVILAPYYMQYLVQPTMEQGIKQTTTCLGLIQIVYSGSLVYQLDSEEGRQTLDHLAKNKFDEVCSRVKDMAPYYDEEKKDWDYSKLSCDDISFLILNSHGKEREKYENIYFGRTC